MFQTVQSCSCGKGASALQILEKLPGSGKSCQGFKPCSILQVSERCPILWSLAAVDKAGTGSSALQVLRMLESPKNHYKDNQAIPFTQNMIKSNIECKKVYKCQEITGSPTLCST